jgi:hypothetical protein
MLPQSRRPPGEGLEQQTLAGGLVPKPLKFRHVATHGRIGVREPERSGTNKDDAGKEPPKKGSGQPDLICMPAAMGDEYNGHEP